MPANASAQLRQIAVALKETGDRGNMNALRRGIRAEAAPLVGAVREAALAKLPRSGGLAQYEASQKIRVAVLAGARTTGVRIIGKASQQTDTGSVRHPVFGKWYPNQPAQRIPEAAGWWTETLRRRSPAATVLIKAELDKIAAKIRAI